MHIIFYGPEGSGKGTQAKLLVDKFKVVHLESGSLVRNVAANDRGVIGDVARKALLDGKYVPDSEMYVLWKKRLKEEDALMGWVMDGFPRNIKQARFIFDKVDKYGYKVDKIFYLKISGKETLRRLKIRNRKVFEGAGKGDEPKLVKMRLGEFAKGQKEILEYLREKGALVEIDGNKSIEEIHKEIMSHMSKI